MVSKDLESFIVDYNNRLEVALDGLNMKESYIRQTQLAISPRELIEIRYSAIKDSSLSSEDRKEIAKAIDIANQEFEKQNIAYYKEKIDKLLGR